MSTQSPASVLPLFTQIRRGAQRRVLLINLLQLVPLAAGAALLGDAIGGFALMLASLLLALCIAVAMAWKQARRHDLIWLTRQLDRAYPAFEDSSAIVLVPTTATRLQTLQQARIRSRIESELGQGRTPDFRPAYPQRRLLLSLIVGASLGLTALAIPVLRAQFAGPATAPDSAIPSAPIKLSAVTLRSEPPAYTGASAQTVTTLDAKLPIDSKLSWQLRFDRDPREAALVFHDGSRLPLQHEGRDWRAAMTLAASTLYRVELDGAQAAANERLNRLDASPDQPPEIIVRTPEKTLTVLSAAAKSWDFAFEARDDYGLVSTELTVTLAQGSGEQVKVSEQTLVLDGGSDRHQRSYRKSLDLAALGFTQGDDLIVRINVADNHPPQPNRVSSASYILRWPASRSTEGAGLEGLVQKTLPAYFRSERQIIIDTEALQAQRGSLPEDRFAKQADELGVDQKVLRLRYGQFLGEGFESLAEHSLVDADAAKQSAEGAKHDDSAPAKSLKDVPPEAEAPAAPRNGLGQEEDVLREYGHAHDNGEAATLLDPETRRILKAALDEMWQAELNLRQAKPEAALPYEYKALEYIKQVQQAERIYLARAGLELPRVDASRRLSGERKGLSDRQQSAAAATVETSPAAAVWTAIEQGRRPDAAALTAWLREHPDATTDALGLVAAADRVTRDPDCESCRAELKSRLWPLLPATSTGVTARRLPDAAGAAYLDALKADAR